MVNLLHLILTKFWSTDCPWGQLIITAPGTSTLTSPHCCHLLKPDQTCSKTFLFPFVRKDEIMFPPSFQIPRLHQTAACPGSKTPSIGISRLPKRKSGIEETSGGERRGILGICKKRPELARGDIRRPGSDQNHSPWWLRLDSSMKVDFWRATSKDKYRDKNKYYLF